MNDHTPQTADQPSVLEEVLNGDGLTLAAAGRLIPPHRGQGVGTRAATVWRWCRCGAKAPDGRVVKLECTRIGSRWLTSKGAVRRFAAALTGAQPSEASAGAPATRQNRGERAVATLKAIGC